MGFKLENVKNGTAANIFGSQGLLSNILTKKQQQK